MHQAKFGAMLCSSAVVLLVALISAIVYSPMIRAQTIPPPKACVAIESSLGLNQLVGNSSGPEPGQTLWSYLGGTFITFACTASSIPPECGVCYKIENYYYAWLPLPGYKLDSTQTYNFMAEGCPKTNQATVTVTENWLAPNYDWRVIVSAKTYDPVDECDGTYSLSSYDDYKSY